jgi:hypothetical protein
VFDIVFYTTLDYLKSTVFDNVDELNGITTARVFGLRIAATIDFVERLVDRVH